MQHCLESDIQEIAGRLEAQAPKLSGTTVLLCGGAGFLGRYFTSVLSHLNERVLERPCRIIVCDNLITSGSLGNGMMEMKHLRFIPHNIIEPFKIDEPIDYVIQAAGIASPYYYRKYPLETLEAATVGTKQALLLGLDHRLKGFLFFSSSEIYGDPDAKHVPTPESYRGNISCTGQRACYDESKRLGETMCTVFHELYGIPTRVVRPFNVFGPGMDEADYRVLPNFASRIAAGRPLQIYGSGTQTRTFCYVTDAIVGFMQVLLEGTPGQSYNIGNPVPEISMLELAKILGDIAGRPLPVQMIEYPDTYPADEPQRRCPDINKAARQLKYKATVPLEEGLRRFLSWTRDAYTGSRF